MKNLRMASLAMFVAGLVLFLLGIITGETRVYIVVIVPVIQTSGFLSIVGILLIFGAFFLWVAGHFVGVSSDNNSGRKMSRGKVKTGGVIFIGPIPIVFSNDRGLAKVLVVLAMIMAIIFIAFYIFIF